MDAAELVGVHVLGLIDDNTACHLQYGTSRIFENSTHRMLVYNMGATSTQVSIAEYTAIEKKHLGKNVTAGVFEVIAKTWDESLGGNNFDEVLMEYFVEEFNTKFRKKDMVYIFVITDSY